MRPAVDISFELNYLSDTQVFFGTVMAHGGAMASFLPSFSDHYASVYDAIYREKPCEEEANFVFDIASEILGGEPKQVIDFACRTGRHVAFFAQRGCYVHANDFSSAMIERTHKRLDEANCRHFRLSSEPMGGLDATAPNSAGFDLAFALDTSIGYLIEDAAINGFLRSVLRILRPGGVFFADVWNGRKISRDFEPNRERVAEDDRFWVRRVSRVTQIPSEDLLNVEFQFTSREKASNGIRSFCESHCARYHWPEDLEGRLRNHGFEKIRLGPFFSDGSQLEDSWHFYIFGVAPEKAKSP